jgi:hypothetical protein
MVLARFPAQVAQLVMDGAYATKRGAGLPDRVTVTSRMRSNAAVFALAPPRTEARAAGAQGRPAGDPRPAGRECRLAPVTITGPDRRTRVEHIWHTTCLWYGPFHTRPVVVVLIRKPDRGDGFRRRTRTSTRRDQAHHKITHARSLSALAAA